MLRMLLREERRLVKSASIGEEAVLAASERAGEVDTGVGRVRTETFSTSGYVLRLRNSTRRAKGVKVEGRSCVRLDGDSVDGSVT